MLGEDFFSEEEVDSDHENSFESKSVWARISVVFAGPLFNIILAFILSLVVMGIVGYDNPEVTYVDENSVLYKAGLREGDIITEFDGESITLSRELMLHLYVDPVGKEDIEISYIRDGKEKTITVTPEFRKTYALGIEYMADENAAKLKNIVKGGAFDKAGVKAGDTIIAIEGNKIDSGFNLRDYFDANPLTGDEREYTILDKDGKEYTKKITSVESGEGYYLGFAYNAAREEVSAVGAFKYSIAEIKYQIKSVFKTLSMLFTGGLSADDFTGPVGIVDIIDETYEQSKDEGALMVFLNIANLTLLISANLGMMNLLPIPGLDGGRLIFLLIEAIFRKPVPKKFEGAVTAVCMIAIMLFAVYVMFNDIRNLF